jgi:hypothetical protein
MTESSVLLAQKRTMKLIDFLVEVTEAAERTPELDILKTDEYQAWRVLWVEEIPADAGIVELASDGAYLTGGSSGGGPGRRSASETGVVVQGPPEALAAAEAGFAVNRNYQAPPGQNGTGPVRRRPGRLGTVP